MFQHFSPVMCLLELLSVLMTWYVCKKKRRRNNFKEGQCNMTKLFNVINNLITRRDQKIISEAAKLLVESDKHDQLFAQECAKLARCANDSNVVKLGTEWALVRLTRPAVTTAVTIQEVMKHA